MSCILKNKKGTIHTYPQKNKKNTTKYRFLHGRRLQSEAAGTHAEVRWASGPPMSLGEFCASYVYVEAVDPAHCHSRKVLLAGPQVSETMPVSRE